MPQLLYRGESVSVEKGETALEALERAGFEVRASCRAGACQSCLHRARSGEVSGAAQEGLGEAQRDQGYFLACRLKPTTDVDVIEVDEASAEMPATIAAQEQLSADVFRLELVPQAPFDHVPGQFVHIVRPDDGVARSYSLASLSQNRLEIHVRRIEGGALSPWLSAPAAVGQSVILRGPFGTCVYQGDTSARLLLGGTSTGLAPLLGIVRDALHKDHQGPIALYHGSLEPSGLYLRTELEALAAQHDNLELHFCVLNDEGATDVRIGQIQKLMVADHADIGAARIYLCGAPSFVNDARKKLFLAGASLKAIHVDSFAPPAT